VGAGYGTRVKEGNAIELGPAKTDISGEASRVTRGWGEVRTAHPEAQNTHTAGYFHTGTRYNGEGGVTATTTG